jgi:hypothetical protein
VALEGALASMLSVKIVSQTFDLEKEKEKEKEKREHKIWAEMILPNVSCQVLATREA